MKRMISIRIIDDNRVVRRPVVMVRLKEGALDHAFQVNLRGSKPDEVARDIQHAVQKLLDDHVMPQETAISHWEKREIWVHGPNGNPESVVGTEYRCHKCGKVVYQKEPHCPACGAIMREPREEDM